MRQRFSTLFLSRPLEFDSAKSHLANANVYCRQIEFGAATFELRAFAEDFRAFNCWKLAQWKRARIFGFDGIGGEN